MTTNISVKNTSLQLPSQTLLAQGQTITAIDRQNKPITELDRKAPATELKPTHARFENALADAQSSNNAADEPGSQVQIGPSFAASDFPVMGGNAPAKDASQSPTLREAFDDFVGQSFYGQLIGSMRKTVGKPAYFHGGRAEEVFQSQLDQQLAEHLSDATADSFTGPMFELFSLPRR